MSTQHTTSLTIVGTGIELVGHVTEAAKAWMTRADQLFYVVANPAVAEWIIGLNPRAKSLSPPQEVSRRRDMYRHMADTVMAALQQGGIVVAAFYGHPTVGVSPVDMLVRRVQKQAIPYRILPAVSSLACLFADLALDPLNGCQIYEATDFLNRQPQFDPQVPLILGQIAMTGNRGMYKPEACRPGLERLITCLQRHYDRNHPVILYEAKIYPVSQPKIESLPLAQLPENPDIPEPTTLYIPPLQKPSIK